MTKIITKPFGTTSSGEKVTLYRLCNSRGAWVELLDYGCVIHAIVVPDAAGKMTDVCLGYDTLEEYEKNDGCLGAVVGRHANRIAKGEFTLNGQVYHLACNNGPNHLHGGNKGFDRYVWTGEVLEDGVRFSRISPDGEEGYPGNLRVSVIYTWDDENRLTLSYRAESDADTVVNLTNHCYFNLAGKGTVLNQLLQVDADRFTEVDHDCLTTGKVFDVTPAFDFRRLKPIGQDIGSEDRNLYNGYGYDHNFVFNQPALDHVSACLKCPENGICMEVRTNQPGVQVYSGNFLTERKGKAGQVYHERDAVCLETQHFPNSLACGFEPSAILRKGEILDTRTIYAFSAGETL